MMIVIKKDAALKKKSRMSRRYRISWIVAPSGLEGTGADRWVDVVSGRGVWERALKGLFSVNCSRRRDCQGRTIASNQTMFTPICKGEKIQGGFGNTAQHSGGKQHRLRGGRGSKPNEEGRVPAHGKERRGNQTKGDDSYITLKQGGNCSFK